MAQNFLHVALGAQSLFWVFIQDLKDEILRLGGDLDFFWKLDFSFLDEFEHQRLRLIVEGGKAVHHLVDQDSQRPPISSFIVASSLKHLGREVFGCPAKGLGDLAIPDYLCHAEVSQAHVAVIVHEHVFQFEVSVYEIFGVQVAEAEGDLHGIEFGLFFGESFGVGKMLEELSSSWVIHGLRMNCMMK